MKAIKKSNALCGGKINHINRGGFTMTESQMAIITNALDRMIENQQRFMEISVQVLSDGLVTDEYLAAAKKSQDELFAVPSNLAACAVPAE